MIFLSGVIVGFFLWLGMLWVALNTAPWLAADYLRRIARTIEEDQEDK